MDFSNTYVKLPSHFYARQDPIPVLNPELVVFNERLASELGVTIPESERARYFSGNQMLRGSEPIALAYAGHQFGHFVPSLGDGRALLLGEIRSPSGYCYDVQLKGSGRTPYSRQGDGRAALGPMIREYIVSEAMHALGIPTTRALAVAKTGEMLLRDTVQPGAILTRIASSHIRVGTFEYFAARHEVDSVRTLADYAIARHFPYLKHCATIYLAFLLAVLEKQASLIAHWMALGFIHGVMNTDNMAISGETIDYGPCAFLDEYDPHKKFSSIDHHGRYAFSNQAAIALWNIQQLYYAIAPLIDKDTTQLSPSFLARRFWNSYEHTYSSLMLQKIGLFSKHTSSDKDIVGNLLDIMHRENLDFTLTFRSLVHSLQNRTSRLNAFCQSSKPFTQWLTLWHHRLRKEPLPLEDIAVKMENINPAIIPRNHLIEKAINMALLNNDFSYTHALVNACTQPYQETDASLPFMQPPQPDERVYVTFCGT